MAKTLLFRFSPRAFDAGFCQHLSHADFIIIESPLAQQALCHYLALLGHGYLSDRICVLPHQTIDGLQYDPAIQKRPRVVAVGRWQAHQKDAPLLMKVLGNVLPRWPAYEAVLFGSGRERLESLSRGLPDSIRARIKVMGPMAHAALCQEYQAAQVMFFSSRFEGFPVAAGEALSCGCSVVGAATLPSMNFICSQDSGTLAASRNHADMADALAAEFDLWSRGRRDPAKISQAWRDRVSVSAIVRKFLERVSQETSRPNPIRDA